MHPAFSVILFTTLSGTGCGLLALLGLHALSTPWAMRAPVVLPALACALLLVTAGLLASLAHLGQPLRAWRAFSQWRSSWLSREGVASLLMFAPAIALAWCVWRGDTGAALRVAGAALFVAAIATTVCTAMIYASLPPIAAWRDRAVVPNYLALALLGGALWFAAISVLAGRGFGRMPLGFTLVLAAVAAAIKLGYWKRIDRLALPSAAAAIGLPGIGTVRSFERPHTETNYLLREMGFVLARKHATRLRAIALALLFLLPCALAAAAFLLPAARLAAVVAAALLFQLGALVERWLFFAQARHTIATYYGVESPRVKAD
jgi:DMSO reductase anchor subunit